MEEKNFCLICGATDHLTYQHYIAGHRRKPRTEHDSRLCEEHRRFQNSFADMALHSAKTLPTASFSTGTLVATSQMVVHVQEMGFSAATGSIGTYMHHCGSFEIEIAMKPQESFAASYRSKYESAGDLVVFYVSPGGHRYLVITYLIPFSGN